MGNSGYSDYSIFDTHYTTRGLVDGDGPPTQAMITVLVNRDLALSDRFVQFIKRNSHSVRG
jgi:hypothetical protein